MNKALLIIDLQRDFVDPGGALYFDGAEEVVEYVIKLVKEAKEKGQYIFTTQDWHDEDDAEFNTWPKHCVKNTDGARLTDKLEKALEGYDKHVRIYKTRFSAFYNTDFEEKIKAFNLREFDVVGVVTHICVLFTVEELRNRGFLVNVHKKGVKSYDEELHKFAIREMEEILGAKVI